MNILRTQSFTTNRVAFLLCVASLLFTILGLYLNGSFQTRKILADVFYTIGFGIFITTFVSVILNRSFKTQIEKFLLLVAGAKKVGIRMIFENRQKALPSIIEETKRAENKIDILAIAGTDFFGTARDGIMIKLGKMAFNDSNVKNKNSLVTSRISICILRAIIEERFDLNSQKIENFDYTNSKLWKNIFRSLEEIQFLLKKMEERTLKNFKIEIRLFESAPMFLYYYVNNRTFVEQYHNGSVSVDSATFLRDCIGKKVPVLEYYKGTNNSKIASSHFESIWKKSSKWKVLNNNTKVLEECLAKNWLAIYNNYENLLNNYIPPFK